MSIEDEIKESLEKKDLDKFRDIITRPKIYMNDIFGNGILHYILVDHKDAPMDFIQALVEQESININKINSENELPPLLCTDREDIQDLLLGNIKCNVNKKVNDKNMMSWALENNKLGLLKKLINHPQIDLLGENDTDEEKIAVTQSMANPEVFKLFLESPRMNVDALGWNGMIIPLEYSLINRWIESTLLLLERGADINIQIQNGLTIAESIMDLGNPVLIKFILDNFHKVKDTERLLLIVIIEKKNSFTYSSMEHDIDLIGTLIRNKCLLTNRAILEALGSIDVLNTLIDNVDKEISLEKEEILIETVLISENIDLVNKLLLTKFALKNKIFILGLFDKIKNPLIINSILSVDELVKDQVSVILCRNSYSMFVTLLKMGEPGIERINHLLDISNVQLPSTFPPLGLLIKFGTESNINLVKKLLEHHGVLPQTIKEMYYFITSKRMDIIEILIRKSTDVRIFGKTLTSTSFMELVKLLSDNTELLDKLIIDVTSTDRGKDIIQGIRAIKKPDGIENFIKTSPEIVLLIIKTSGFDLDILFREMSQKMLVLDLLQDLPTEDYKNEVLTIVRTGGKIQQLKELDLLRYFIDRNDIESVRFLMRNGDVVSDINVHLLIGYNPHFMYEHLREIFSGFEPDKFNLKGAIQTVLSAFDIHDLHAIFSNDVLRTIIRHPKYNPSELYQDLARNQYTQLQIILLAITRSPNQDILNNLLGVFREVLENPRTDPNQLNGPKDDDTTQTVLDSLLIYYIDEYEEKEYNPDEPLHMILQMLLKHPRLNITHHYYFQVAVCRKRLGDLFTHMISRPEFDMDEAGLLDTICNEGNDVYLNVLLTLASFDINHIVNHETALHRCIKFDQDDCAKLLIEDPRIDLSVLDENGRNYAEIAAENNRLRVLELLRGRGVIDNRHERMEQEAAEYEARMAALGRRKQGKLKEALERYDEILKERENPAALEPHSNITLFSKALCPFCLVPMEKTDYHECLYLGGHTCDKAVRNEALMAKYLGPNWETKHFEVCCTCGRPGNNHGHYRLVPDGETSSLAAPGYLVNHWRCDQYNGGGGKEEMITRLVGILSYLKVQLDTEQHLEDNVELTRQLALEADKALFDQSMKDRAALIFQRKAWNAKSTIEPYKKYNAPRVALAASARVEEVREPIVHIDNRLKAADEKDTCGFCFEERDDLYRPHESDTVYICDVCLYKTVCVSPFRSVTCVSGCIPKKQIHKEDVQALMGGQLCELMAPIAAEKDAQAAQERRNYNARRAGRNNRNDELEDGEIRD